MTDKEILNEILRYSVQLELIQAQLESTKQQIKSTTQQIENGMETVDRMRNYLNSLIKELSKEQND